LLISAMGKKQAIQKRSHVGGGVAMKKAAASVNPFEMKKTKSRFDVLGRSMKGAATNVIKARSDAVKKRKSSLLVEYKAMRKANSFTDRRFGQNDSKMSE
jgi:nucleolar protein 14